MVSSTDTLYIKIKNKSDKTVSSIPIAYQVQQGQVVKEVLKGTIEPNGESIFACPKTIDLTKPYNVNIQAWIDIEKDVPSANVFTKPLDCVCEDKVEIKGHGSITVPYVCHQIIVKHVVTSTPQERKLTRDSILKGGGKILETIKCDELNLYLDRLLLPEEFQWGDDIWIGAKGQVEGFRKKTTKMEDAYLNYLTDSTLFKKLDIENLRRARTADNSRNENSTPVKIVVLDSGIDTTLNKDVAGYYHNIGCPLCLKLPEGVKIGYDFMNMDNNPDDDTQRKHGTTVSTIFTDILNGRFDDFHIIPIKILNHDGVGSLWEVSYGLTLAKILKADIVNASIGWYGEEVKYVSELIKSMNSETDCHGLFVASAGNTTTNVDLIPHFPSGLTRNFDHVLSVTALNGAFDNLANYANYGQRSVDVAAPGDVLFRQNVITFGTSFAAPYVAGNAALAIANRPNLSAANIKLALFEIGNPNNIRDHNRNNVENLLSPNHLQNFFNASNRVRVDKNCGIHDCNPLE
jgi:subtilisin family serine protease